jgi:hypothetical protein
MALEAAAEAQPRADVEPGQAANYGDAPAELLVAALEHRDRIAALLVDVEHLVQRALDEKFNLLARSRHLPPPGLAGATRSASAGKDYSPQCSRPADDCALVRCRAVVK